MAHDDELADRLRNLLVVESDLTERKMFGGLAFLLGGHLTVAASGQGGMLARIDASESDRLIAAGEAEAAVMRGRPVTGWVRVDATQLGTEAALATWVDRARAHVRTLPPKA